jgi:hypothetical protein
VRLFGGYPPSILECEVEYAILVQSPVFVPILETVYVRSFDPPPLPNDPLVELLYVVGPVVRVGTEKLSLAVGNNRPDIDPDVIEAEALNRRNGA